MANECNYIFSVWLFSNPNNLVENKDISRWREAANEETLVSGMRGESADKKPPEGATFRQRHFSI